MAEETFTALERDGWDRNAADYDRWTLHWTSQAFGPLLDGLGDVRGKRLLDVASGTGHLARAAAERGAAAEGIDIAPSMVARASRDFPGIAFRVGSAEALPYADASFDAVTCCFGLLHMERPEAVLAEFHRVLRPGGRFAYAVWHGPEQGGALFDLFLSTFRELADLDVGLPPAPPFFQFADPAARDRLLHEAGFAEVTGRDLTFTWRARRPEDLVLMLKEGMVRNRMLFDRQAPAVQQRILATLVERGGAFMCGSGIEIPTAAHLATASKPAG
ncbi:MAG: methyltransferase domain-containing protein [Dongiaceae bacterium]